MILNIFLFHIVVLLIHSKIKPLDAETISGCTIINHNRRVNPEKTSVKLSCANNGYILVKNLTFGVHKTPSFAATTTTTTAPPICSYQPGDCTTRTTYIGMECNGLTSCDLDLNPQYLHICSQYSDYMVLDYSCLQGQSLSVCENRMLSTTSNKEHHLFLRSPNYPYEYENSLNCSCQVNVVKSQVKFLDFYLEERDEINACSRDHLQIDNRSYCGSSIEDNQYSSSTFSLNSTFQLTFKTNDVITRKGFWLMMTSEQPIQVSCNNLIEPAPTSTTTTTTSTSTSTSTTTTITTTVTSTTSMRTTKTTTVTITSIPSVTQFPLAALTENSRQNYSNDSRRHTLSYILTLTLVLVIVLLLLNVILIILCWRQRRIKRDMGTKVHSNNRPFLCSIRSSGSSSSSITYGETPVLSSLDAPKQPTLSTRYIFQPNQQHLDTTPSTSTTTATGPYDDLNESITLQRHCSKEKPSDNHSLYMQNRPTFSSPNTNYNRMIHFPPVPIRCNFSTPIQTFYPPQPLFDSQHIYETIQDGQCPYQRLAATLRRQQPPPSQCTCFYEHNEQIYPTRTHHNENVPLESNPETLV